MRRKIGEKKKAKIKFFGERKAWRRKEMRRKILSWRLFANRIPDKKHRVESDFIIKIDYNIFFVFAASPARLRIQLFLISIFHLSPTWVIEENCNWDLHFDFPFFSSCTILFAITGENWIEWIFIFDYNFIAIKRIVSDYRQWYCIPL